MRWIAIICVLILTTTMLYGCGDPATKYKLMSFFFDGVPHPDAEKAKQSEIQARAENSSGKITLKKYGEHGPFAAKLCEGCHARGATNRLIMPVEALCNNCHVLRTGTKNVHGPIAGGGCIVCHEPHGSGYPFLLVSEPQDFCLYCHKKDDVLKNPVHSDAELQCTTCHDAHMSDNEFLLR